MNLIYCKIKYILFYNQITEKDKNKRPNISPPMSPIKLDELKKNEDIII